MRTKNIGETLSSIHLLSNLPFLYYHRIVLSNVFLLLILSDISLAHQTDSSGLNETHVKHINGKEDVPAIYKSTVHDGLHWIQLADLPDLLPKSCALIGIPPYSSQLDLEPILLELSNIFQDESSVFIGQFLHPTIAFNSSTNTPSDHRSKIFDNHNQLHTSNVNGKDSPSYLAFYAREPKDRTCLLNPPKTMFNAVPYTGQINVEILVQFVNENCHVFRTPRGTLTHEGLFHQHMLLNLYSPKHSEECLEIKHMPTKMEFFNEYLFRSRPVIIKNAIKDSLIMKKWSSNYLRELYGPKRVHVKLTNDGVFEGVESAKLWSGYREDRIPDEVKSQLKFPDLVVVRPATSEMLFSNFLDLILLGNLTSSAYLEYSSIPHYMPELVNDIHDLPFLDGELKRKHLNMWLSDGNTLGKLHFDPYDNFLCQVRGLNI